MIPTEPDQLAAIKARLHATTVSGRTWAYTVSEIKKLTDTQLLPAYAELHLARRGGVPLRAAAGTSRSAWRLSTRVVAGIEDNAWTYRARVRAALERKVLVIGEARSTPVVFEGGDEIQPDGEWFTAFDDWTFVF
jgi:hypothetical protein